MKLSSILAQWRWASKLSVRDAARIGLDAAGSAGWSAGKRRNGEIR